jgi:SAM-dependent methyltransferase
MTTPSDTYTHGHQAAVLRSHTWRTVDNSAAYLAAHLVAGSTVLDVGCGPGTITVEMAQRVGPNGHVTGIDRSAEVLARATEEATAAGVTNVSFASDDVYALDHPDDSFDVVHAHQVLQHLTDPVAALREMRRVVRPGGVVGVRDADYAAMAWAPRHPLLDRWLELYHQVTERNDAEADAGRFLLGWAQQAGFTDITSTSTSWTYATPTERSWWGGLWAERILESALAEQAVSYGLSDRAELQAISEAWLHWSEAPDGWFAVLSGEVLATK